ncbi:MAG: SDR family NAD(P)-dependent oxidoreductase [Limnospira sp.]
MNVLILGASGGIGLGFVEKLLREGRVSRIYATYRHRGSAEKLLNLADQYPQQLVCLQMDIGEESDIVAGVETIRAGVETLDLAINCVGILHGDNLQPEKSLRQVEGDRLMEYFRVNSIGGVLLAKHLLPLFPRDRRSVFASISAKVGSIEDNHLGGWYGYRASKAALNMLMRTAAIEYGRKCPQAIVVLLHPGTTDTPLSKPFQRNVPPDKLFSVDRTVDQLMAIVDRLDIADSGQFFSWDGTRLPY